MYRKKLRMRNMRLARSSTGMYNHWDDHEFVNDFSIPEYGRKQEGGRIDRHGRGRRSVRPVHDDPLSGLSRR